jgi:tetratricopeptide (TPR) repeat protein
MFFTTKARRAQRAQSFILVCFVLFVPLWCSSAPAQSRAEKEERAIALIEENRFAEARAILEALLADDPSDARLEAYLAAAELHSGEAEAAITRVRGLLERDPEDADLHVLLGQAYMENRDWALAEKEWRAVLQKRLNSEEAHTQLARTLLQLGRFQEGLREAARATEINPRRSDAHALQGNILASLGRMEEAVNEWNRALASDPNNSAALAGLAVYLRSWQPDVALEYARRAVELSQWNAAGPIRILSLVHRSRQEYAQAHQVIEKALRKFPDDLLLAGELRLISGEEQAARGPAKTAPAAGEPQAKKPPDQSVPLGDVARYYREQQEAKQQSEGAKKNPPK